MLKIVFMIIFIWSNSSCASFTDNVFPFVHGNYYSFINSTTQLEEYKYCHVDNVIIIDMNIYPNDDLLISYYLSVVNGPIYSELQANISAIVKTDHTTGKTLWAKELYYNVNSTSLTILRTFINNNKAWIFMSSILDTIYAQGVVVKADTDGNIIEAFFILNSYSSSTQYNYFFNMQDFYLLSDLSIIAVARCSYNPGEFGVSLDSQYDCCLFKIDDNREFKWSTSIDYLNDIDESCYLYEYNSIVYIAMTVNKNYYCLLSLDQLSGVILKSKCTYVNKDTITIIYRRLRITLITDKFIYVDGGIDVSSGMPNKLGIYMFNINTLELIKVFMNTICNKVFGFINVNLARDEFHCRGADTIATAYIYDSSPNTDNPDKIEGFVSKNPKAIKLDCGLIMNNFEALHL